MHIHKTYVDDVCCFTRNNIVVYTYIEQRQTMCVALHEAIQLYAHTQNRRGRNVLWHTRQYVCISIHKRDVDGVCCCTRCNMVEYQYIKQMQMMCVVHVLHMVIFDILHIRIYASAVPNVCCQCILYCFRRTLSRYIVSLCRKCFVSKRFVL